MPLTDGEQRRLAEIDTMLRRSDSDLDRVLSTGRFRNVRLHLLGTACGALSLGFLVTGVIVDQGVVCTIAWLLLGVGTVLRSLAG